MKEDTSFVHYSGGESLETGFWGINEHGAEPGPYRESLMDRVEVAVVTFLQKNPVSIFLEIEEDLYPRFPGLLTPSKSMIYAVLNSYAEKKGASWKLRSEDVASARRAELSRMSALIDSMGRRLKYKTRRQANLLIWEEAGRVVRIFSVLASAMVGRAMAESLYPPEQTLLVIPGGRALLVAYKAQRDAVLAERLKNYRLVKYRLLRALSEVPILTRKMFEEQIAGDPIEQIKGQMMMF
jgi:hypothetical protein